MQAGGPAGRQTDRQGKGKERDRETELTIKIPSKLPVRSTSIK
jgi:hypothetical protein